MEESRPSEALSPDAPPKATRGAFPEGPRLLLHPLEQNPHLGQLYEISKQLMGFQGLEHTFSLLMTLAAQVLPLRTALVFDGVGKGGERLLEHPHVTAWRALNVPALQLDARTQQAVPHYAYLLGLEEVQLRGGQTAEPDPSLTRGGAPPAPAEEPILVTLPLVAQGSIFGTIQLEVDGVLAEEGLAFFDVVANQLAEAMDRDHALRREVRGRERAEQAERSQRAQLERERRAHRELENVHRRQAFLVRAGAVVTHSPDYHSTLPNLAQLLVPEWADCCVIDLFPNDLRGEPGNLERVALVTHDPLVPAASGESFVSEVLASHPWVALPVSLPSPASQPVGLERAEWDRFPSNLRLSLQVRGRRLGFLGLIAAQPGRYGAGDAALFEALAQRIAAAVDAAHLYQQAQEAVRWRDELISIVSHDLMSPLLVVRLNAELLLRGLKDSPQGDLRQDRLLKPILQATHQMRDLASGLLERARLEGKLAPLALRPQEVGELVAEALEVLQPLALNKSQRLRVALSPGLPRVSADRARILQVLNNLVGNALKFTPQGGTITVGAQPVEGLVRLWVKDSGPGIAPEDIPHLFERFWRAANASERGTGLGLHIAKSLVMAHGGALWAESRVGEGSTFFFTLPIASD